MQHECRWCGKVGWVLPVWRASHNDIIAISTIDMTGPKNICYDVYDCGYCYYLRRDIEDSLFARQGVVYISSLKDEMAKALTEKE